MSDTTIIGVSRNNFKNCLARFKSDAPAKAAFITFDLPRTANYYVAVRGNAGFGVTQDGELIALFNHSAPSGTGEELIELARERGAKKLMCFDTQLAEIYRRHGFEETDRAAWDESLAPEGWNYDKFGKPDVIWMKL